MSIDEQSSVPTIVRSCKYLTDVRAWPMQPLDMDVEGWLRNFDNGDDREIAAHLLNSFVFYNNSHVDQLFKTAFHALSRKFTKTQDGPAALREWRDYIDSLVISHVTGETPSTTDSGHFFARKARKLFGVDESRILNLEGALEAALKDGVPLVLVDDFAGTGNQLIETIDRTVLLGSGQYSSIGQALTNGALSEVSYVCTVATRAAKRRIATEYPSLTISAAHEIDSGQSVSALEREILPQRLHGKLNKLLRTHEFDNMGTNVGFMGFGDLALSIAFEHSVPDGTLPVFWGEKDGWKPLLRRT